MRAQLAELDGDDASVMLPALRVPTLLLHRTGVRNFSEDLVKKIASNIPGARSLFLEGTNLSWYLGDVEPVHQEIQHFLSDGKPSAPKPGTPEADTHTILFTDMEGSTTLADRHGDQVAQEVRRAHNQIVRSALDSNGGNEIKHTGDGIMASFATASSALDSAISIQRGVAAHRTEHPDSPLGVYVGLNAGEPIAEDDDLFGTSVNLAARICAHAQPGQIVAADVVRQLPAGKQFLFADLGATALRGFEDPIKLWELRWEAEGSP